MDDHSQSHATRASAHDDPITGAAGAHPGVGVGEAAGRFAGKAVAEYYDPTIEEQYWRGAYADEPYYQRGKTFDDYAPAYRLGGEAYGRHGGIPFEKFEDELADQYQRSRGTSRLSWDEARPATYAAWNRLRGDIV